MDKIRKPKKEVCFIGSNLLVGIGIGIGIENVMELQAQREVEAPRQYYLAVDRPAFKMGTLIDLLEVLGTRFGLPMVLCCGSRDVLDALCEAISSLPYVSFSYLYSDMAESERASTIENFRQKIVNWFSRDEAVPVNQDAKPECCYILIMTDACLPMPSLGEAPLLSQILINYDLPMKKEAYLRRLSTCILGCPFPSNKAYCLQNSLAAPMAMSQSHGPIVLNMVVGGEVVALKTIEEGCNIVIEEMPMHISELV